MHNIIKSFFILAALSVASSCLNLFAGIGSPGLRRSVPSIAPAIAAGSLARDLGKTLGTFGGVPGTDPMGEGATSGLDLRPAPHQNTFIVASACVVLFLVIP